jgi:hypothetical protein
MWVYMSYQSYSYHRVALKVVLNAGLFHLQVRVAPYLHVTVVLPVPPGVSLALWGVEKRRSVETGLNVDDWTG